MRYYKPKKQFEKQIENQKSYIASLMLQIVLKEGKEGLKNSQSLKEALHQLDLQLRASNHQVQAYHQWRKRTLYLVWVSLSLSLGIIFYWMLKINT